MSTDQQPTNPVPTPPALDTELEREIADALGGQSLDQIMAEATQTPPAGDPGAAGDAQSAATSHAGASAEETHTRIEHEMRRGKIASIRGDDVFVEMPGVGGKNQGVVPLRQFERPPRVGSIMDFVVERIDDAEGLIHLSREGAISRTTWDQLSRGAIVEARVVSTNKGGLELEMVGGIRAFMPASQIDFHHVNNMEEYVGQKLLGMVQEIDRKSRKVVMSRRAQLEQERNAKREKILAELEVGQIREGKVSSLVEYGAFIDIGGVDGLLHVSDISYTHITKPSQVLSVGQTVSVKVLKLDKEHKKISLGLKQVAPDPWEGIEGRIRVGDEVSGRVLRLAEFGAFIEVEAGIEGLLPVSEVSWKRNIKLSDTLKEGELIRLKIMSMDVNKRRISLSLKQAAGDPWMGASRKYEAHQFYEGTVLSTTDFGAFVELEPGVEGLVHISEISDQRINAVSDVLKQGQVEKFRILEVDEDQKRIRLSLKAYKEPEVKEPAPQAKVPTAEEKAAALKKLTPKPTPKKSSPGKGGLGSSGALGLGLRDLKL